MKELQLIENYVIYLIRECGLSVTIHPIEKETLMRVSVDEEITGIPVNTKEKVKDRVAYKGKIQGTECFYINI